MVGQRGAAAPATKFPKTHSRHRMFIHLLSNSKQREPRRQKRSRRSRAAAEEGTSIQKKTPQESVPIQTNYNKSKKITHFSPLLCQQCYYLKMYFYWVCLQRVSTTTAKCWKVEERLWGQSPAPPGWVSVGKAKVPSRVSEQPPVGAAPEAAS